MSGCPMWCVGEHDDGIHASPKNWHEDREILVRLMEAPDLKAGVWVNTLRIPVDDAEDAAALFSRLGHPEIAATITRLGKLADADSVFTRPQPAVDIPGWHHEVTIGAQPGVAMDPVTHKVTPVTHKLERLREATL